MNQIIFTIDDKIFNNPCVFTFCQKQRHKIKGIVDCDGFFSLRRLIATILILGIPDLCKLVKRAMISSRMRLQAYCQKENIPYLKTSNVNGQEVLNFCKAHECQLIVSINTPQKIKQPLLAYCPGINLHFADLPEYKGLFPVFWALKNKEKRVGISVHIIEEKIDEGKVISKDFISSSDMHFSFFNCMEACFRKAPETLTKALEYFDNLLDSARFLPLPSERKSSYYSIPRFSDIIQYKRGKKRQ